jgi:hypothetical protein
MIKNIRRHVCASRKRKASDEPDYVRRVSATLAPKQRAMLLLLMCLAGFKETSSSTGACVYVAGRALAVKLLPGQEASPSFLNASVTAFFFKKSEIEAILPSPPPATKIFYFLFF